jgi:mRNA-degrading endonuclease toxin of MazEF toxin-antitoxin module
MKIQLSKGDIVLVSVPFVESLEEKLRPALVLHISSLYEDVIIVPITTKTEKEIYKNMNVVYPTPKNGLHQVSVIIDEKIMTISNRDVKGVLGLLEKTLYQKVLKRIRGFLK